MIDTDLKRIERATYRSVADSGLWDIFLACIVAMFAIAPLLSVHLGDFWSSAVFLPVFAVVLLVIRVIKDRVIRPRIGIVDFSRPRRQRLVMLAVVMLVVNVVALIVGIVVATQAPTGQGQIISLGLSLVILVGFSLAALFLEIPRVFFYGLLMAVAPPVGEALFSRGYASHHGFPIVFGVCATVILVSGIVRFVRFLPTPQGADGYPVTEGTDE
jgi:hypothetical protein